MLLLLAASLAATARPPAVEDKRLAQMAALYDQVCLKAFPDDKAVAALMAVHQARELSPAEVKVTMRDDPARGWDLGDRVSVWTEFPPFHACSVRWSASAIGDLGAYRAIADEYERKVGGFEPMQPFDTDDGDLHIRAVGEQRTLPDRSTESLFFFEQHITDPKRRAAGETGVSLRFVHQFAAPASAGTE